MAHQVVSTDDRTADAVRDALAWQGIETEFRLVDPETEDDLIAAASDAEALVVDSRTQVTERVLVNTPVRTVARTGVGVDNVDLDAAENLGITVVNAPEFCVEEAATHTVSLVLATWRRLRAYDAAVRRGEYTWETGAPVHRFRGSTVGFFGLGRIARRVVDLLAGFELQPIGHDPHVDPAKARRSGVELVQYERLLRDADVLCVTAPLTDETRNVIGSDAFAAMKPGAILVNTGRGELVDHDALADALESGRIAGAGLDVLPEEPPSPLPTTHPDVVYTPHVGWYSEASLGNLAEHVAAELARIFRGDGPTTAVRGEW